MTINFLCLISLWYCLVIEQKVPVVYKLPFDSCTFMLSAVYYPLGKFARVFRYSEIVFEPDELLIYSLIY